MKTRQPNELPAIAYISLLAATVVATVITQSALVFIGGLLGTTVVVKILAKGIWG